MIQSANITRRSVLPFFLLPAVALMAKPSEPDFVHYPSLQSLWDDLYYNRIKRKHYMTMANTVVVQISPVQVFMVLEGKGDYAGTIVVNDVDAGERPSVIAYVNVPNDLKKESPPLEEVKRGDRLGILGFVFSLKEKGVGQGSNPYANALNMAFGKFSYIR